VVPSEVNGRVKVKVVYTVLEAQYQSALTAAVQAINSSNKTVCFELVGYLLEELRDVNNFEAFKKDLEDANVFIGSLIFIEELAEKVMSSRGCRMGGLVQCCMLLLLVQ
jgi:magnesium chelatase subunit H